MTPFSGWSDKPRTLQTGISSPEWHLPTPSVSLHHSQCSFPSNLPSLSTLHQVLISAASSTTDSATWDKVIFRTWFLNYLRSGQTDALIFLWMDPTQMFTGTWCGGQNTSLLKIPTPKTLEAVNVLLCSKWGIKVGDEINTATQRDLEWRD